MKKSTARQQRESAGTAAIGSRERISQDLINKEVKSNG